MSMEVNPLKNRNHYAEDMAIQKEQVEESDAMQLENLQKMIASLENLSDEDLSVMSDVISVLLEAMKSVEKLFIAKLEGIQSRTELIGAYIDRQNIPYAKKGDKGFIGGDSDEAEKLRSNVQTQVMREIDDLKTLRQVLEDKNKEAGNSMNTTSQAITKLSDVVSNLLQILSTGSSTIFRS
jgi:hypothetical protein